MLQNKNLIALIGVSVLNIVIYFIINKILKDYGQLNEEELNDQKSENKIKIKRLSMFQSVVNFSLGSFIIYNTYKNWEGISINYINFVYSLLMILSTALLALKSLKIRLDLDELAESNFKKYIYVIPIIELIFLAYIYITPKN